MKRTNIIYHNATVTRRRRNQLNKHKSVVIWFTGLSGSGKSTLAHSVEEIVGQFTSNESETIEEINLQEDGSYLVDSRVSIRELNKVLKIKLPYDSAKTLNGLILENLQSFPQHNVSLKIEPLIIEIVQVSKQGVKLVRINKIY